MEFSGCLSGLRLPVLNPFSEPVFDGEKLGLVAVIAEVSGIFVVIDGSELFFVWAAGDLLPDTEILGMEAFEFPKGDD